MGLGLGAAFGVIPDIGLAFGAADRSEACIRWVLRWNFPLESVGILFLSFFLFFEVGQYASDVFTVVRYSCHTETGTGITEPNEVNRRRSGPLEFWIANDFPAIEPGAVKLRRAGRL